VFHFHPLAIRDCSERCHIPKLHAYPDHLLMILHAPEPGPAGHIHLLELDYFAGHHYLVTVHGPINPEVPLDKALRETRAVARRLLDGRFAPTTSAELSHAIVSMIATRMEGFVDGLTHKVASLERRVIERHHGDFQEALEEMFQVRHELLTLRTMAAACHELYARMSALMRFLPPESQPFIEDLKDHFERVRSVCDSEREFLQGVVDFYQSRTSAKMNHAMERLALMSAVLLPLTLLSGIYGMNIIVNSETRPVELGWVLASMGVTAAAVLYWARRQGWW
jgi:Mg2+ and Co2+ transporter CorA